MVLLWPYKDIHFLWLLFRFSFKRKPVKRNIWILWTLWNSSKKSIKKLICRHSINNTLFPQITIDRFTSSLQVPYLRVTCGTLFRDLSFKEPLWWHEASSFLSIIYKILPVLKDITLRFCPLGLIVIMNQHLTEQVRPPGENS